MARSSLKKRRLLTSRPFAIMTSSTNARPDDVLHDTIRQLWGPALDHGSYRVTHDGELPPTWRRLRSFVAVGPPGKPSMLVQSVRRKPLSRSLVAYQGLRDWRPRAARVGLAALIASGAPIPGRSIHLDALTLERSHEELEPLTVIEKAMGRPLFIHLGMRASDNAKATAQLFAHNGSPAGYAKIAWSELTDDFVRTEESRLKVLAGRAGFVGAPRVLKSGDIRGRPYVVTEPLPRHARRLNVAEHRELIQMSTTSKVRRIANLGTSRRLQLLVDRMQRRQKVAIFDKVASPLINLGRRLLGAQGQVPILAFDHGDLVPWNACRDPAGRIWLWDWELSEEDTIAGTDAIHWMIHSVHGTAPADPASAIAEATDRASSVHRALGMGRTATLLAAAYYVLIFGERACSLAESHGSWDRNRVGEASVREASSLGHSFLDRAERQVGSGVDY